MPVHVPHFSETCGCRNCMAVRADRLKGRIARCSCGTEAPSDSGRLAFIEYRGPGSRYSVQTCKHCRYHDVAHEPEHMEKLVHINGRRRPTVVEDGRCPGFEPIGPQDYDTGYCGCRGWN